MLKEEGCQMGFARNGKAALAHARSTDFDLILLDIMMPEMDGFEVCTRLKEDPKTMDVPVIFLTARTDAESIVKGFEAGAVDYVTKSFNKAELLARVRPRLTLKRSREDLKKSNERLRRRESEPRELNVTKDKFFSIIAHDLRNPFNALINGTELLMLGFRTMDEETLRCYMQEIHGASTRTFHLLGNLLDWARSQTGRIGFHPEKTDPREIVEENVELMFRNADDKKIRLRNEIGKNTFVYADPNMLRTVIRNLVTNAVKFTPPGGTVRVASKDVGDFIQIEISDTGVGIEREDLEKLFKIEVKHSTAGTEDEKGSGLGLILCREFVVRNGGEIHVESEVGNGSRFYFTLPKVAAA